MSASAGALPRLSTQSSQSQVTRIRQLIERGNRLSDDDDYYDAIRAFTEALQTDPDNGAALAGRAIAYAATNRLDEALRDVEQAQRSVGDNAIVHRARGLIAERRSDNAGAIAEFTAALSKDPADSWSLFFRASLYQQAHKDVAALADAETFVEAHPRSANGYILRGRILLAQHNYTVALLDADRLVRLFPDEAKTLAAAAEIYNGARDRHRALQAIDRAIALEPDRSLYRYMRTHYHRWDDFADRRADLNAALQLDPENLDAVTELAQLDFKQRRWSDAIAGFTAELAKDSRDYGVLAYRAMAYLNTGQQSLAQADHSRALEFASGPNDLNNICWAFASEGFALDWAMDACDDALKARPDQSRYLANRALAELRLGKLDQALADYDRSIAADPKEARAYYGRAVILSRAGKAAAAIDDRKRALELDPGIEDTFESYGVTELGTLATADQPVRTRTTSADANRHRN
jgi:tetratricopeptide (TPR) repeat protein